MSALAKLPASLASWLRDPNPILVKELRAIFRTNLYIRFLYLATGIVALFVLSVGVTVASGDAPPATVGQVVFHLFFGVTLFVISLVAPGFASASITTEREQGTWESLLLSGMSARRVVLGKFLAAYASIALVVVALSPVVGIAFLFGGVSPVQVLVGLLSMLIALAPAIAFGVAVSARLPTTRLAIALSTIVYLPTAAAYTSFMAVFGDVAHSEWGLATEGPFFYTEAFATRAGEWDTWLLLIGGTIYFFGMPTWFLLATAVAGVQPPAEDRSSALKRWAIAMSLATALAGAVAVGVSTGIRQRGEVGMLALCGLAVVLIFYGLLFVNEPPLPPRPWTIALAKGPRWRRALGVLGPGAAGTLRFAVLLIVCTAALGLGAVLGVRHLDAWHDAGHLRWDRGALALIPGATAIALFTAAFGTWMRLALRQGLAARVLTTALLLALAVLPFMLALVLDSHALDRLDREAPLLVHLSTAYPMVLAVQVTDREREVLDLFRMAVPVLVYGLPALGIWAFVEARVRRTAKAVAARRARFAFAEPVDGPGDAPGSTAAPGSAPAPAPVSASAPAPGSSSRPNSVHERGEADAYEDEPGSGAATESEE